MNAISIYSSKSNIEQVAESLEQQWSEHHATEYRFCPDLTHYMDMIQEEFFIDRLWEMRYNKEDAELVMNELGYYEYKLEEWRD